MERFAVASPLGSLTVTLDGDNVTRLEFPHSLRNGKITQSAGTPTSPAGVRVATTLETYFACGDLRLLKLSPGGTAFQRRVWEALRAVPAGETATYGLMSIPPFDDQPRDWFRQLRQLRDTVTKDTRVALPELSMGMSHDFAEAIAEGATLVRVGTAIFGARN